MLSAKTPTNVIKLKKENNRERSFLMNAEELARYKNMSAEEIDRKIVPDIEDIKDKKNAEPISILYCGKPRLDWTKRIFTVFHADNK